MNRFTEFSEKTALSAESVDDMKHEIDKRTKQLNPFPLHVFHPNIRPLLSAMHQHFDLPKSFIGLTLLSAYSSAVGTSYAIKQGDKRKYFCIWGCLEGMTSSGKSLVLDMLYAPLFKLQDQYDKEWAEKTEGMSAEKRLKEEMPTITFRDVHVPTLVRSVLPSNPKGVVKISDEILEWVNGMNQLSKKEGTDEQFWLSGWNGSNYSGIRSGKDKFVVPRVFVNVIGGVQDQITYKLFGKDKERAVTGFIYRLLFATPTENRIADPDPNYTFPKELIDLHHNTLTRIHQELTVEDGYEEPYSLIINREASQIHQQWKQKQIRIINRMSSDHEKNIHAGILGKMSEYAMRFAGLLNVSDQAYDSPHLRFKPTSFITENEMNRAIELAEYFYNSALEVSERVDNTVAAPMEVARMASLWLSGKSMRQIGNLVYPNLSTEESRRKKAARTIKSMMQKYPRIFKILEKQ